MSERTRETEKRREIGGRGSVREGTQKEAAVRGREQELQPRKKKKKARKDNKHNQQQLLKPAKYNTKVYHCSSLTEHLNTS